MANLAGVTHSDLFEDYKTNKYDGVHIYGPKGRKVFTKSILDILMKAVKPQQFQTSHQPQVQQYQESRSHQKKPSKSQWPHQNRQESQNSPQDNGRFLSPKSYHKQCPQTLYQQKNKNQGNPPVQVSNRFSVFNSNQGNF